MATHTARPVTLPVPVGTVRPGYSPTSVRGYRYYLRCEYVAVSRQSDGVVTWRCRNRERERRGYGKGAYFGRRDGAWVAQAAREGALFGAHGRVAVVDTYIVESL